MQTSDIPGTKFTVPFGNTASGTYKQVPIPTASQIGVTNGAASLTDGFPPLNFQSVASGGVPPRGKDVNGILYEITGWNRWQQAGGPIQYDPVFSAAIGGYPAGAVLMSNPAGVLWLSTVNNNTSNPDAAGAGWEPLMPVKAPDPTDAADDVNFVTPAQLADVLDTGIPASAVINTNGSYPFPGIILKWGRFTIGPGPTTLGVSFNPPFPTNCFSCLAGGGSSSANQTNQILVASGSITTNGFIASTRESTVTQGCYWAIGN